MKKDNFFAKAIMEKIELGEYQTVNIGLYDNASKGATLSSYFEKEHFEDLLKTNKISQLFTDFLASLKITNQDDLHDNILLLNSRFNRNEEKDRKNIISDSEYNLEFNKIINSIKEYLKDYKPIKEVTTKTNQLKTVFLSYNHKDKIIAEKIKHRLEKSGISVTIDLVDLAAGEDIKSFIEKSIMESDTTLSLVSLNSLLSSWVSMETINTLYVQKVSSKKFIAAFIDNSFFKRNFVDDAMDKVEWEISEIKNVIKFRLEKNRPIDDLHNELSRYNDLLHSLPKIIQRLKESLSVDIADANFETGIEKIIESIKS